VNVGLEDEDELTIMSRRVSLLTLKGMFLITIAVGMTSSSFPCAGVVGALTCDVGGEPPAEEKSELLFGESDLISGGETGFSSHCFDV
jgi:hypothetical protein